MRLNFQLIYFLGLTLFAFSLPLSPFLLSVSQFILVGNWILEGNFRGKLQILQNRKALWIFPLIFLAHLAGMLHTVEILNGLHDLKIKLPLLILPLIIGTSQTLSEKVLNRLLIVFGIATFIGTLVSFYYYLRYPFIEIREISVIISHIRLSILVNISIFSLSFLLFKYYNAISKPLKISGILIISWMVFFLYLLQSITGAVVFLALLFLITFHLPTFPKSALMRKMLLSGAAVVIVFLAANMVASIRLFTERPYKFESLELTTVNGNPYLHFPEKREMEGGNYVWLYISDIELERGWNAISELDYSGKDLRGHELRTTLIRYLTSKGLRKDSVGLSKLSQYEIERIENGKASSFYFGKFPHPRIYQVVWELDVYFKGANPSGKSIAQRIEYWKNSVQIIKRSPIVGVGTGDVQTAFNEQYEKTFSLLEPKYRLRAHNQLLTFSIALGIPAMILLVFALIYPISSEKKWSYFFARLIILTSFISMLNEDTLETQAGVSFIAFFYSLFIFGTDTFEK